ncbi:hypothetical protein RND81_10G168800 [Saponaria officinalis]|uniref:Neprosin PEP catalytic domain-containing protein n=1 Tax=Saponaria officinalis TaxID=3572 RepID=A0AAW1I5G6_SAPOF
MLRKQLINYKSSIEQFGRKGPSFPHHYKTPNEDDASNVLLVNRSFAVLITEGFSYNGAKADIKVWNPYVEHDDEYSSSRIALKTGHYKNYESIEAGWIVNPSLYGDRQTRIYAYWTAGGSNMTGCFDLLCPGFVQTSNEVAIGGVIQSIPDPGGLPWILTLYIVRDTSTSNWWLQYQENTYIGYWPAELFGGLSMIAESVQWGGEKYSSRVGHPGHTQTEMGSGVMSRIMTESSGWTKRMRIRDNSLVLKYPQWVSPYTTDYDC